MPTEREINEILAQERTIEILIAAGHVTREKVEQARSLVKSLRWDKEGKDGCR